MKQQEIDLIVEAVAERVSRRQERELQSRLAPLEHNITRIRSCLERLERILEARAAKALEAEDISRMVDATRPMLSHIMEATQPKSLSDQVDEIKALCDKLGLTIVPKG